jgi:hypothetical protein
MEGVARKLKREDEKHHERVEGRFSLWSVLM